MKFFLWIKNIKCEFMYILLVVVFEVFNLKIVDVVFDDFV